MLSDFYIVLLLLLGSFFLTYQLIPKIISVSHYKKLMADPNERSSHSDSTPNLGGISFFITVMLSFYFLDHMDRYNIIPSLIPGLTIMFIIGLKDDLTVLTATTKLMSQILASLFLVVHYKFEIYNLYGFMGITSLDPLHGAFIALFLMVAIINAFNLIDGIDGLASIVGLIIFFLFSFFFYQTRSFLILGICVVMMGCLAAFLRYNFSRKRKIFMGDTGSLIVGFIIAAVTIRLLSLPPEGLKLLPFQRENVFFVVGAILIIPMFDMTRVFFIRVREGRGPFSPDRNHIHHLIIDKFALSHGKASIILGIFNILFTLLFLLLSFFFSVIYVAIFFVVALLLMALFLKAIQNGKMNSAEKKLDQIQ